MAILNEASESHVSERGGCLSAPVDAQRRRPRGRAATYSESGSSGSVLSPPAKEVATIVST
eukprot:198325-Prymnesium_polylepis.1